MMGAVVHLIEVLNEHGDLVDAFSSTRFTAALSDARHFSRDHGLELGHTIEKAIITANSTSIIVYEIVVKKAQQAL